MTEHAAPKSFWAASAILLLWSLAGVGAFGSQVSMGSEQLAQLPEAQRNAFAAMPVWTWIAYGVATVGGLAAAICLLLRRSWAVPLYAVSLIAVIVQFSWTFAIFRIHETVGPEAAIFPLFIIVMGAIALFYSHLSTKRGWLV